MRARMTKRPWQQAAAVDRLIFSEIERLPRKLSSDHRYQMSTTRDLDDPVLNILGTRVLVRGSTIVPTPSRA